MLLGAEGYGAKKDIAQGQNALGRPGYGSFLSGVAQYHLAAPPEPVSTTPEEGAQVLARRTVRPDLACDPDLPDATRLWAALQRASGGTWGGCVFDVDAIVSRLSLKDAE